MKARALAIIVAISAGCAPPASDSAPDSPAVAVTVARAGVEDMASWFEAGGVVRSRTTAVISSRVMAPIRQVHVRAGDRVSRGSTLVTLDARDMDAERRRAEAESQSAAESVRAAEADVRAAEGAFALARATHDRMATLFAKKSATAQELDQAVAALTSADAQRTAARSRLAAAEASRAAADAAAQAAAITSTYAVLPAPFDGVVTDRYADEGSMATPGSPLLTLEEPTAYRLEVQLDEARARLVQTGQPVLVQIDGAEWSNARVAEIARVDPASHTFVVKIDLPSTSGLRSGLFGRARFTEGTRQALMVPGSAVIPRGQLTFVYVVDGEERARLRPISTGASDDGRTEVLAGLRAGDAIVANPPASLVDGARVDAGSK